VETPRHIRLMVREGDHVVTPDGRKAYGYFRPPYTLVMASDSMRRIDVVREECLHAVLYATFGTTDHGEKYNDVWINY